MTNKKYHNIGTTPKSNREITETEPTSILLTHIVMIAYFSDLEQALEYKIVGLD